MTDNESIKALSRYLTGAKKCGSVTLGKEEMVGLCDLFNRQKAEIERLQKAGEEAVSCFTRMESLYKIKCKELEIAKSEAYREFALDLKCGVPQETGVIRCDNVDDTLNKLLSNDIGRYDHYTDSFVKEPTESNE